MVTGAPMRALWRGGRHWLDDRWVMSNMLVVRRPRLQSDESPLLRVCRRRQDVGRRPVCL